MESTDKQAPTEQEPREDDHEVRIDAHVELDEEHVPTLAEATTTDKTFQRWQQLILQIQQKLPEQARDFDHCEPLIQMEVSDQLSPFVDTSYDDGQEFFEHLIPTMRERLLHETGLHGPSLRISGYISHLKGMSFVLRINKGIVKRGALLEDHILSNIKLEERKKHGIDGHPTLLPTDSTEASWVRIEDAEKLEDLDVYTWEQKEILLLHLTTLFREYAHRFATLQKVQELLDGIRHSHQAVIDELLPDKLSLPQLTVLLKHLLEERVSVRDLPTILDTLASHIEKTNDIDTWVEEVRYALREQIITHHLYGKADLWVFSLEEKLEVFLARHVKTDEQGSYLQLKASQVEALIARVQWAMAQFDFSDHERVIVTASPYRRLLFRLFRQTGLFIAVLSRREVADYPHVHNVHEITLPWDEESIDEATLWDVLQDDASQRRGSQDTFRLSAAMPEKPARRGLLSWLQRRPRQQQLPYAQDPKRLATLLEEERREQPHREQNPPSELPASERPDELLAMTTADDEPDNDPADGIELVEAGLKLDAPPFADQTAYLHEHLRWLKMKIIHSQATMLHHRASHQSPLFQHPELSLIHDHPALWPEVTGITDAQLRELTLCLERMELLLQARIEATHSGDVAMPLEKMLREFQLTQQDKQLLLLCVAFSLDPQLVTMIGTWTPGRERLSLTIRLASWLLASDLPTQLQLLQRFAPNAPLRQHRLVSFLRGNAYSNTLPLEERQFYIEPSAFLTIIQERPKDEPEASSVIALPTATLEALHVPTATKEALQQICSRFLTERGLGHRAAASSEAREAADKALPDEAFAAGLVFLCHHAGDQDGAPALLSYEHDADSLDDIAHHIARALRRRLAPLSLARLCESNQSDAIDELICTIREARLGHQCLLIDGVELWQQRLGLEGRHHLREQLAAFTGPVFLVEWPDEAPPEWSDKVVLRLRKTDEDSWQLTQEAGPHVLKQARRHGLQGLEELLALRIVGHEDALKRIVQVVRTAKAQLDAKPERPDGVFLLAGPSGSGKTETALALNEALYGRKDTLLRLDMSEFHFRESVSSLLGTTPGFIGYEQGGRLTNFVQKMPESVVLLDEIEKAHPLVLDVFLQVFDDGRLTDGQGQTVDFSRVTFLLTTNIGADVFLRDKTVGFVTSQDPQTAINVVNNVLRKQLRPEFINRFDDVLVFMPLTHEQQVEVCQRQLKQLQERFARRGIWLDLGAGLAETLLAKADQTKGARGIQRSMEQHISQPLTDLLLDQPETQHIVVELTSTMVEETPTDETSQATNDGATASSDVLTQAIIQVRPGQHPTLAPHEPAPETTPSETTRSTP